MDTTPDKDRIVARVRKMLTLANDAGATEGERDNALRMAHATIAKYNLDLAEIEASGRKGADDEPRAEYVEIFYGRPWARIAVHAAARLFFCEYVYTPAEKGKDTKHRFFGRRSNALAAIELSKFLVESIAKEARKRSRAAGAGNEYLRSFAVGAAHRVRERVDEIIESTTSGQIGTESKALVLASLYDRERDANLKLVVLHCPRLGNGRNGKGAALGAYAEGRTYGNSVRLQKSLT